MLKEFLEIKKHDKTSWTEGGKGDKVEEIIIGKNQKWKIERKDKKIKQSIQEVYFWLIQDHFLELTDMNFQIERAY